MGLFFEQEAPPSKAAQRLHPHVMNALELDPNDNEREAEAQVIANQAARELVSNARFKAGRFMIALAIFVALVVGGAMMDVTGHGTSSNALYGFAGTVFGVVAAFLGTEKSSGGV
jgi:hypothetical protein